jgi:pimeloyl-ACP methyl ester carboxylesterase
LRGHGRSEKHPPPDKARWFGEDLLHLIEMLDLSKNNLLGIGHSLGGYALTLAAAIAPRQLFRSLLLFDPAIYSSYIYEIGDKQSKDVQFVFRRRDQWSSVEDMISHMEKREHISQWPKDVLRDYCTYALDENFKLQCTPAREFHIYLTSVQSDSNIYQIIKDSKFINDISIHIVRVSRSPTETRVEAPPTASKLVKWVKKGRDTHLKDAKHLFPMEQPQLAIDLVKQFIEENKNLRSHL